MKFEYTEAFDYRFIVQINQYEKSYVFPKAGQGPIPYIKDRVSRDDLAFCTLESNGLHIRPSSEVGGARLEDLKGGQHQGVILTPDLLNEADLETTDVYFNPKDEV